MNIKTERLKQKKENYKCRVEMSDGNNTAVFLNDGSGKLKFTDFIEGITESGSLFIGKPSTYELNCVQNNESGTKQEQSDSLKAFIEQCLTYQIKFADYPYEYEE